MTKLAHRAARFSDRVRMSGRAPLVFLLVFLLAGLLAGCTTNPATGEPSFTPFMSKADEVRIGREEHPKILKQFGGEVADPEIRRYAQSIVDLLVATSETPEEPFKATILNTDVVNAFALPGGYVYATRGLMTLAGNEAEFAGVLGHEIGHVTARHTAQRYSQSVVAQIGAVLAGAATGNRGVADLANLGAGLYLTSFSRDQEFEADMLGVRYMSRAGYDPGAMASFLDALSMHSALEDRVAGKEGRPDGIDFFSTHPRTEDRVSEAISLAGERTVADPMLATDIYMKKIDGMIYGSDPKQGVIRNRSFIHPELRFTFDVPKGFRLVNSESQVLAVGPDKARIIFDMAPEPVDGPMAYYLSEIWAPGASLTGLETITINGLEAATAAASVNTTDGEMAARLVAIRKDVQTIYRFLFLAPAGAMTSFSEEFRRTTHSFRLISAKEAAAVRPLRLHVFRASAGDSVAALAAAMPFDDFKEERFRALNGLTPGQGIRPGQWLKTVRQ